MLTAIFYRRTRELQLWTSKNTTEYVFCPTVKRAEDMIRDANARNAWQQELEVV
jgi:hypothetical protein